MDREAPAPQSRFAVVVVAAAAAAILTLQLLIPPIVGLANNGDFDRVMGWVGLHYPTDSGKDNYVYWILPKLEIVRFGWRPSSYLSSETPLAAVAVLAARVFSDAGFFDIRVLGGLHMILLLIAVGTIVASCRDLSPVTQWLVAGLLVFVFTDVGYAASFNSLYSQTASLLFLMLTAAAVAMAILRGRTDRRLLIVYLVCATLFVCSKPQESLQGSLHARCSGWACSSAAIWSSPWSGIAAPRIEASSSGKRWYYSFSWPASSSSLPSSRTTSGISPDISSSSTRSVTCC